MIVSVSLNASIDKMVEIESFQYGGMNRIQNISGEDAAGKGINVALAAKTLGLDVACIGFLPEENADSVLECLDKAGCRHEFIRIEGCLRVNTKIYDRKKGVVTELNEAGPAVTPDNLEAMIQLMQKWQDKASVFVLTGSLPPGCPVDFYRQLISQTTVRCIMDTEGEKLLQGLKAKPFLIKPNDYELELAVGRKLQEKKDMITAARELITGNKLYNHDESQSGGESNDNSESYLDSVSNHKNTKGMSAGMALVSMGGKGAFITDAERGWFAPPVPITVKSTVGAGDCMVAGILYGLTSGTDMAHILRCGMAAGTAGCLSEGTQLLRRDDFLNLIEKVQIKEV